LDEWKCQVYEKTPFLTLVVYWWLEMPDLRKNTFSYFDVYWMNGNVRFEKTPFLTLVVYWVDGNVRFAKKHLFLLWWFIDGWKYQVREKTPFFTLMVL
jgi:hypothetical protein